jgi:hypothetical protein
MVNMGYAIKGCVATVAMMAMLVSVAEATGVWTFADNQNTHVQYHEGRRLVFQMGCSRLVGFDVFYPDQSRKEGEAEVELSNGKTTLQYQGELYVPESDSDSGVFDHNAVMLFVELQDADELLTLLTAGLAITVTTDAGKILLSAPDIKDLKGRWDKAC